jgi:hypothetical protein
MVSIPCLPDVIPYRHRVGRISASKWPHISPISAPYQLGMIILTVLILSDQAPILPMETIIAALPSSINITINRPQGAVPHDIDT